MEKMCDCGAADINIPEEGPDFNSPGNIGSWRQLFAENIGKYVKIEVSVMLNGNLRMVCGVIYAVGNSYVALKCDGKIICADILAVRFATFE